MRGLDPRIQYSALPLRFLDCRVKPGNEVMETTMLFRILFAIDLVIAAIALFFFFWGLSDGTVFYAFGLWAGLLAGIAAVLIGGYFLHAQGQRILAYILLLVLALPGLVYGLFILLVIVAQPNWR
jgi:hypothetical protein